MKGFNGRSLLMVVWTVVWTCIGLVTIVIDPTGHAFMYFARIGWAPQVLWVGGIKVVRRGGEGMDWRRPYVVTSNHQSQVDIPILFASLPMSVRFLAKRSLFYIPVFGWSLWFARFVPVDRGSSRKARRSIDTAAVKIRNGPSLAVFPEGTRTPNGKLQAFKSGAFVLAVKSGVSVLPVAIRGSYDVVPKHRLGVKPGTVELIVGNPISTDTLDLSDREKLKNLVRDRIQRMLDTGEPA
ncbi:MAG: 1-acyl-sn-glycerol-3-phosphate acyltransferase [Proteobacteria bacterium]|jgi:1-acyl-sn-glycerol-3-phosphate acyltransferase|nr:1-acyl-sn-glycerol-3-phosphate acyltransferase [Pseudomonadota bacterium]